MHKDKHRTGRIVFSCGVMALLITLPAAGAWELPRQEALFMEHTSGGSLLVEREGLTDPGHSPASPLDSPATLWSRYLTDAIFTTAADTTGGYAFAGSYLNPPMEAALYAPDGGGTPGWAYGGTEFYVDAGDSVMTLAAVETDGSNLSVHKWSGAATYIPEWTAVFAGYGLTTYGPIAVSDDGSTIAVIGAPPGTDAHLLLFDAGSATPLVDYTATGLGFPRYVKINADGRYTAFIALSTLVIYDRDTLGVRDQFSMGATNSAMDISGDGNLVAYGWSAMYCRQWNGSSYGQLWSYNPGAYYVSKIAISADGSTIVSGWYNAAGTALKVAVHEPGSSTPLWTYNYATSNGTYQEHPADIDITDNGSHFIVGSWGDDANLNPEVHIFQRSGFPLAYHTVDMPGSVFSVDISGDGGYAVACGKHIHANVNGRGGDMVAIDTGLAPASTIGAHMTCLPSAGTVPFTTTMTVTLNNLYTEQTRRIAGRINVEIANGSSYSNWKSGWTNVAASTSYVTSWNQTIPSLGSVIGDNVFSLEAEDVTPSPYNQPPNPPAGDTDISVCTVTGIAP